MRAKSKYKPAKRRGFGIYSKKIASILNNDSCRPLGIVTKGLDSNSDFPKLAIDLDGLHLDEEELSYEVTCQNVQERPPFHSINNIRQPFLPCISEIHDENENFPLEGRDRLAHVLSRQHLTWIKKCQNAIERVSTAQNGINKSEFHLQEFKNYCLGESDVISRILQDSNINDLRQSEYETSDDEGNEKVPQKESCKFCNKDINPKDMKQHIKRIHKIKPDDDDDENENENNPEVEKPKQLDYTRCVYCKFLPTWGSKFNNKYGMINHYIVNHFREKSYDFLKLNNNSVPPYKCHECGFSPMIAQRHTLLRHYAGVHGILDRFYQEALSEPEPDPKQQKPPPQSLDYTRCVYCGFTTTCKFRKSQMTNHYIRKHFKEKCHKIFKRSNKFHKPPFFCHQCSYSTRRDKHELFKHYARHHGILERFCEEKFNKFNSKVLNTEITDRNAEEVEEITVSEHVPEEQSQNDFQNAENTDPNSQIIPIPDQGQNDFRNNVEEVIIEQDDDDESNHITYKCDFCTKVIETHWNNMKTHVKRLHPKEKNYTNAFQCKCDFCNQKFSSWNDKVAHVEDYHKVKKGIPGRRPDWGDFRVGGKQYVRQKIDTMLGTFEEYTFGSINLYTNSCIQSQSNEQKTDVWLADHTGSIIIGQFEKEKFVQKEAICDNHLSKFNSRVYGFENSDVDNMCAIRYEDGISVIQKDDKQLKTRIITEDSCSFCDMTFLPYMDSILALDTKGKMVLHDYLEEKEINTTLDELVNNEISRYQWSTVQSHQKSVFLARIGTRKQILLYDVRKQNVVEKLFNLEQGELCGNFTQSQHSPYQMYMTTNLRTILIDERFVRKPMTVWYHANIGKREKIPHGILSHYIPNEKLEYVFSYWPNGDVNMLCNDWKHSICPQRFESDVTTVTLSCQKSSQMKGYISDIIYPLSRGKPVMIPSMNYLSNHHFFDKGQARILVPWTGMTILSSEKESEIKLVAVNAVGDIFKAVLNHESRLNQDIIDQTNYDDVTMDFDLDDSEINTTVHATSTIFDGESSVRSFNTSKSEDLMALEMYSSHPVDNYKLEWMKFRELNQKEHEVLDNWEQQLKTFRKVAFASELFQREALPQNIDKRKIHTIKEIPSKEKDNKTGPKEYKYFVGKFKNCPFLTPLCEITKANESKNYKIKHPKAPKEPISDEINPLLLDQEAQDVLKIFAGERPSIFGDVAETSDDSGEDEYESVRSKREPRKKRKKDLTPGLPEDTRYTMDQFLQGLDPEMTSTQQTQFTEDPSMVETEEFIAGKSFDSFSQNTSRHEVQSKGSSKKAKKKKRKSIVGF